MAMRYPEQVTVPVTREQLAFLTSIKRTSIAEEIRRMIDAEREQRNKVAARCAWMEGSVQGEQAVLKTAPRQR